MTVPLDLYLHAVEQKERETTPRAKKQRGDRKEFIALSERCYKKVGRALPVDMSLEDVAKSLPRDAFTMSWTKAFTQLFMSVALITCSVMLLSKLPWFLLPLGWAFTGMVATGLFVIGRDCAESVWVSSTWVNKLVGTLVAVPLAKVRTNPVVAALLAFFFLLVIYLGGVAGLVKYWLAPLVGYHIMMYAFMRLRNTFPAVDDAADGVESIVFHTVRARIPKWMEFLTHGVNVYLPSLPKSDSLTSSLSIPSYRVRTAYAALQDQWGSYFSECRLSFQTLREVFFSLPKAKVSTIRLARLPHFSKMGQRLQLPTVTHPRVPAGSASAPPRPDATEQCRAEPAVHTVLQTEREQATATAAVTTAQPIDESELSIVPKVVAMHSSVVKQPRGSGLSYWLRRIHWLHVFILFGVPLIALYGYLSSEHIPWQTWAFAGVYYFLTGLGITAGYHRLWSHKAYDACLPAQYLLSFLAAGSVQGSAKWWCLNHRLHHRYTDTDVDPYNAKSGFWYAHLGWMLLKQTKNPHARVDMTDLRNNPVIRFQHKYYGPLVLIFAVILPTLIAGFGWGDFRGGYFIAGLARLVFVHHTTFCVNSVAHFFGDHTFDDERTPKDHYITALLTLGEGYHNFHHEFPNDYRNGIRFYDYDPTKWLIATLSLFGLAWDLKEFPANEISKGKVNMKQKQLDMVKQTIRWPQPLSSLPEMTWEEMQKGVAQGLALVVIDGLVHDMSDFISEHPGGEALLRCSVGTNASRNFHGHVYKHSRAARNLLTNFRIARLAKPEAKSA